MLVYLIFLVAGLLLLLFSVLRLRGICAYVRIAERSRGRVVRQETVDNGDGVYYLPVFEFTTQHNEIMEYQHWMASSSPRDWPVGATQTFIYFPDDPFSARLLGFSIFRNTVLLMALALVLLVTGAGYFLLRDILY